MKLIDAIEGLEQKIDAWFAEHFHNSAISRDESNIAVAIRAKDALKSLDIVSDKVAEDAPVQGTMDDNNTINQEIN